MKKRVCVLALISAMLLFQGIAGILYAGTVEYTYDDAGRLIRADYDDKVYGLYSYDKNGNLRVTGITSLAPLDLNADNSVDLKDVIIALQVEACGGESCPVAFSVADISGDNRIGIHEAIAIMQVVAGLREKP